MKFILGLCGVTSYGIASIYCRHKKAVNYLNNEENAKHYELDKYKNAVVVYKNIMFCPKIKTTIWVNNDNCVSNDDRMKLISDAIMKEDKDALVRANETKTYDKIFKPDQMKPLGMSKWWVSPALFSNSESVYTYTKDNTGKFKFVQIQRGSSNFTSTVSNKN